MSKIWALSFCLLVQGAYITSSQGAWNKLGDISGLRLGENAQSPFVQNRSVYSVRSHTNVVVIAVEAVHSERDKHFRGFSGWGQPYFQIAQLRDGEDALESRLQIRNTQYSTREEVNTALSQS